MEPVYDYTSVTGLDKLMSVVFAFTGKSTRHRLPSKVCSRHTHAHTFEQLVVAVGGWAGPMPSEAVETYDVRANSWTRIDSKILPVITGTQTTEQLWNERELGTFARAYHACVMLHDKMYQLGTRRAHTTYTHLRRLRRR